MIDNSISDEIRALTELYEHRTAVNSNEQRYSYSELFDLACRYSGFLKAKGIVPGDTVVSVLGNSVEALLAFLGCAFIGAKFAPLSCESTEQEVLQWVEQQRAAALIQDSELLLKLPNTPEFCTLIHHKINSNLDWLDAYTPTLKETSTGAKLLIKTSGTTGTPKALQIDILKLWLSATAFSKTLGLDTLGETKFWNYLPVAYLGGLYNLFLIPLCLGGSVYIDQNFNGRTLLSYWATVKREKINVLWLVPTIARGLLTLAQRAPKNAYSDVTRNVKACLIGTAPVKSEEKKQFFEAFGLWPVENYGLSESTFISSFPLNGAEYGGLGSFLPYVETQLRPLQNNDTSDEYLELWIKSPFMFDGYLDEAGNLSYPNDEKGFFNTGDIVAKLDNKITLVGRTKNIIKKGGILINLDEIEQIVESFENVEEAAAVVKADEFYGETYNIHVRFSEDVSELHSECLNSVKAQFHQRVERSKWEANFLVETKTLPRTSSGKIRKFMLQ